MKYLLIALLFVGAGCAEHNEYCLRWENQRSWRERDENGEWVYHSVSSHCAEYKPNPPTGG